MKEKPPNLITRGPFIVCLKEDYWVHVDQIKRMEPDSIGTGVTICHPCGKTGNFIKATPSDVWACMKAAHDWLKKEANGSQA